MYRNLLTMMNALSCCTGDKGAGAPIFEIADIGLVGELIPEIEAALG